MSEDEHEFSNEDVTEEREDDSKDSPDTAFYGFLNVSRNANSDEITAAYKKLARLYHPDKHQVWLKR